MENLTHSLLGAALAETTLPSTASSAQRRVFYLAGIVAANLPDADLLYTSITPPPLGYLLHHRGHTHTVLGLVGLAVLFGIANAFPAIRRHTAPVPERFWILVSAALASHLIADGWNSYGVHPLYPLENRWFYGDAVSIFEPWMWALLGTAVATNAQSARVRFLLGTLLVAISVAAAVFGLIHVFVLGPMVAVSALLVLALRRRPPSSRAIVALGSVALFVAGSFAVKQVARAEALSSLSRIGMTRVVDLVLTPKPGNPLCWSALSIRQDGGSLVMQRADIPVGGGRRLSACGSIGIEWTTIARQSIADLRGALNDCRTNAWLQFGRAPVIREGVIADVRFGDATSRNFTAMSIGSAPSGAACPAHITDWDYPRADVLLSDRRAAMSNR